MAIGFTLVPSSAAASAVFVEQQPVRRGASVPGLAHKVLIPGQYNTGKTPTDYVPQDLLDVADAQNRYGRGSMLALMAEAVARSGLVGYTMTALPLPDSGTAVDADGDIAVTGTATETGSIAIYIAGRRIAVGVESGDTATEVGDAIEAAINSNLDLPVTAVNTTGTVAVTARFGGTVGNQIFVAVNTADNESTPAGLTLTVPGYLADGANDPVLTTAFDNLGDEWYTEIAIPYLGDTELSAFEALGANRIDPLVKRPFIGFVGYTDTRANLLTALDDRNSEFTSFIPVHGSPTPAFEIAGSFSGLWARHHASDLVGRPVVGSIIPGVQAGLTNSLTYGQKDSGVQAGAGWTRNVGSGVVAGDTVTTRTETNLGVATTDWRFAVIFPNLQYKINSADIVFGSDPFTQAVVISDDAPGAPAFSVRPKTAKAYAIGLVDDWAARGLTADRDAVVDNIVSEIDSGNPGRINVLIPDVPSAGLRILAAKIEWAFIV